MTVSTHRSLRKRGVRERVLIKIAATWEGIQSAKQLQKESINCYLTVQFSFSQAVACATAEVTTVASYVGRTCDWYKQHMGKDYPAREDPASSWSSASTSITESLGMRPRSWVRVSATRGDPPVGSF